MSMFSVGGSSVVRGTPHGFDVRQRLVGELGIGAEGLSGGRGLPDDAGQSSPHGVVQHATETVALCHSAQALLEFGDLFRRRRPE